jgi:peptidoglycan-associated lipoprotein
LTDIRQHSFSTSRRRRIQEKKTMQRSWLRTVLAIGFASLALVACKSNGTKEPPPEQNPQAATATPQPSSAPESDISRMVDAQGNPINPNTGQALGRIVYFDYDKATLRPEALALLELHAGFLRNNPDRRVVVEGHCDERGTREYNMALGERRAESVRTFLVSSGVRRAQVDVVSYGEERPVDPGHTESAWAQNRRGELSYR